MTRTNSLVGILSAAFALLVWGVTFASTRALLFGFSALEIQVIRFALAWVVLRGMEAAARRRGRSLRPTGVTWLAQGASSTGGRCGAVETTASTGSARMFVGSEWMFVGMGLTGVFVYQFLENCAIYYTNASNVAILVSFGPVVTALMAKLFCPKSESIYCNMWIGAAIVRGGSFDADGCGGDGLRHAVLGGDEVGQPLQAPRRFGRALLPSAFRRARADPIPIPLSLADHQRRPVRLHPHPRQQLLPRPSATPLHIS